MTRIGYGKNVPNRVLVDQFLSHDGSLDLRRMPSTSAALNARFLPV